MTLHHDPGRVGRDERLSGPLAGLRVPDITTVIMGGNPLEQGLVMVLGQFAK
jgi:hypothetical protein